MDLGLFILVALAGLGIGTLSGMFGVGGGTMIVPLLNLVFGMPMLNASATSLFSIAPTSVSGTLANRGKGVVDWSAALAFGLPGALSSAASAALSGLLPDVVATIAAVGGIGFGAWRSVGEAMKPALDESGRTSEPRFPSRASSYAAMAAVGLFAGLLAGVVGVGGGFVIVPFGISWLGLTMKETSAISLASIAIIALPGIASHALLGHIDYLYGLALVSGTVPGASLGVWLIRRLPERALRVAFGALLTVSALLLLYNRLAG